eukprot:UN17215
MVEVDATILYFVSFLFESDYENGVHDALDPVCYNDDDRRKFYLLVLVVAEPRLPLSSRLIFKSLIIFS